MLKMSLNKIIKLEKSEREMISNNDGFVYRRFLRRGWRWFDERFKAAFQDASLLTRSSFISLTLNFVVGMQMSPL